MTRLITDTIVTSQSFVQAKQQGASNYCFHAVIIMEKVKVIVVMLIISTLAVNISDGKTV